jgi:hypothetical protein
MSCVSKGFNCFGAVVVRVSCAPPKLGGGEWNVAVGEMLRLCETALASRLGDPTISCAWVAMILCLIKGRCLIEGKECKVGESGSWIYLGRRSRVIHKHKADGRDFYAGVP